MPLMTRREAARVTLLLSVSVIVAVVASEYMVRQLAPQVTMYPRYVASRDYEIELPPDVRIEHAQGRKWQFRYSTNHLGRRGAYVPFDAARGKTSIVVLGDSFTFGIGVDDAEVYSQILADTLGADFVVINGGVPGWGLDSEAKWFGEVGTQYDPAVVVLQFTANDPFDSFTGVAEVAHGSLIFHPFTAEKPLWQKWVSGSSLLQRSNLYALVRSFFSTRQTTAPDQGAASASATNVEDHYIEMLESFVALVAKDGRKLIFVSVTHTDQTTHVYRYDIDRFPRIAEAVRLLDASGALRFLPLPLDEMRGYKGSPEGHQWGPSHHRIVGSVLARSILALRADGLGAAQDTRHRSAR
jgi:lysophospholipase L1-like esterase